MIEEAERLLKASKTMTPHEKEIMQELVHEIKRNAVLMEEIETRFLGGDK